MFPCSGRKRSNGDNLPCAYSMLELEVDDMHNIYQNDENKETPQINDIRAMLRSIGDGEINISAYDTAWVALVKKMDGDHGPQFPSSINWIIQNQLPDGSWGDQAFFLVHDRMINTLACVIALKSWNIHKDKWEKGLSFIRENLWRLEDNELDDWMLGGFEITFPQLLDMAIDLGLDVPCDDPALQAIFAKRDLKLARFPKDLLHDEPTTLLFSIEGMKGLDWKRLLKLQCPDGSIMSCPAPTAYALMKTGDKKCLEFLDGVINKFKGGVPCIYPVDLYEHLWVVDRLMRLGISRYFTSEITECLEYVFRHWSDEGLCFTRDNSVSDIDDTAMGFRLLRLHGYHVSSRVFKHFEKDGKFYCFAGEANQSVTAMFSLYRASQVAFPGEDDLQWSETYSREFLVNRRASNNLKDKWLIPKDLPGEIGYVLDLPWRASLPRIETRMYLEQYGGSGDVWIAKVLYRMFLISNDLLLEAAKADFGSFQRLCRLELHGLQEWCNRKNLAVSPKSVLQAYFLAAASIFEPDRATERLGWARTAVLADAVSSHLRGSASADSTREGFIAKLTGDRRTNTQRFVSSLLNALHEHISLLAFDDASANNLCETWRQWLMAWTSKDCEGNAALLIVRTVEMCSGRYPYLEEPDLSRLEHLTSSICRKLGKHSAQDGESILEDSSHQVDLEMRELVQCVLQSGGGTVSQLARQTFLHVVKSFYYVAHCSPETIDSHISRVIFEDVI
ncbi:syn-copalyl diphosphate synthase, chloroplastic-like [Lolium rigidum]|uniref:syn-copalyl diphosphate synthase, chloroplastic-like n=1 Tax=Lolium rigidum TaxID=89674 RepID=UPI001F5C3C6E|nr:syn-copalyl diphosphate synthase, chloroplastic-like [Lolium rigidum]